MSCASDELLARQLQAQDDADSIDEAETRQMLLDEEREREHRMGASAAAASIAASSSPARSAYASRPASKGDLRRILNDEQRSSSSRSSSGSSAGASASSAASGAGNRRPPVTLGLDPTDPRVGDEAAFFLSRVCAQQNRCALSLGVIIRGDVQRAMLFNYCMDIPWLLDSFPQLATFPRVDIVQGAARGGGSGGGGGGQGGGRNAPVKIQGHPSITNYFARLPMPFGVHHTKLLVLFYARGCRVAVVTGNFIAIDWLWKNNASYVQDFPLKSSSSPPRSDFEDSLSDYLAAYKSAGLECVSDLRKYDFSVAKALLIPSIPGYHSKAVMHRYGHMRMRALLAKEPLEAQFAGSALVAQFSSIGSTTEKWMDELRTSLCMHATAPAAANGSSAAAPAAAAPAASGGAASVAASSSSVSATSALMSAASLPPLKIIWPTVSAVRASLEGWSAGGSLCCDEKNMKPFLRKYLHVWDGHGQGRHYAMPHIKTYTRANTDTGELAWALTTSANLSTAAWGQLQKGDSQLMIRHYELGALFLPSHMARATALLASRGLANFSCTPDEPLIFSPRGDLASLPAYAKPSSPSGGRVPLPKVRLVLMPPLQTETGAPQPSGSGGGGDGLGAGSSNHASVKRKHDETTDLTGDDEVEPAGPGASASAAAGVPPAKFARIGSPPASAGASTVAASAASAAPASAASPQSQSAAQVVHRFICPLPFNVNARRYAADDEPWTWTPQRLVSEPDSRGMMFLGQNHEDSD